MSQIRKPFEASRQAYRSHQYPGDLGASTLEELARRGRRRRQRLLIAASILGLICVLPLLENQPPKRPTAQLSPSTKGLQSIMPNPRTSKAFASFRPGKSTSDMAWVKLAWASRPVSQTKTLGLMCHVGWGSVLNTNVSSLKVGKTTTTTTSQRTTVSSKTSASNKSSVGKSSASKSTSKKRISSKKNDSKGPRSTRQLSRLPGLTKPRP